MGKVAVLMLTCDRYSAAWAPFCHGFRKYWPDCPWPLRVAVNSLVPPCGGAIKIGKDPGWSEFAMRALKRVGASTILMAMEDCWLTSQVDTDVLMDFAEYVRQGDADHIRLKAGDPQCIGDFRLDSRLAVLAPRERYRACLQPGFWRVEALLSLLRPGETPWQFEWRSAKRTKGSPKYLIVKSSAHFPYVIDPAWGGEPIKRGKWTDGARKYAEREGLEIDFFRGLEEE